MFLVLAVVLAILWLIAFAIVHIGGVIHLLLVVALIVLVAHLVPGLRSRRP